MKRLIFISASLVLITLGIVGYVKRMNAINIANVIETATLISHAVSPSDLAFGSGQRDIPTQDGYLIASWRVRSVHNIDGKPTSHQSAEIRCVRYRNGTKTPEESYLTLVQAEMGKWPANL